MKTETRDNVFSRDDYRCVVCGEHIQTYNNMQIAHRIHKGVTAENHIMQFIWEHFQKDRSRTWVRDNILENANNLLSVCSLKCNDKCNIFFKPVERDALLMELIQDALDKETEVYYKKRIDKNKKK